MSLESALLGHLNQHPMTGYDLKKAFDRGIGNFWTAPQSQIYTVLHRLEELGCVDKEVIHQETRPSRKLYHITDEGKAMLHDWLSTSHVPRKIREPFLLHLWLCGAIDDDKVLRFLDDTIDVLEKHLAYLEAIPGDRPEKTEDPERDRFFWYMTLNYGIRHTRFLLEWTKEAAQRVRRKEYADGKEGALRGVVEDV